ncbi:hypothetical protein BJ170DRAFT_341967 [Xylariales sp. AK1849]|nr:hypothetical protein BJ170DRAFT_341967 [Xylariales sp. AK1849]
MLAKYSITLAAFSTVVSAGPVYRTVDELDQGAFEKAQQRDATATRAFSNTEIKTSDGRCLFVDELSGDSSANLTPILVATCGATSGQGWDVITQGTHNDADESILVVSTLTQACFTYDPSQDAGNQVFLFSCGGVEDGSGNVTDSQLFAGDGSAGPLSLAPENKSGLCLAAKGNIIDVADCQDASAAQIFTFDGTASEEDGKVDDPAAASSTQTSSLTTAPGATDSAAASGLVTSQPLTAGTCEPVTVTVTASAEESSSSSTTTTIFVTVTPSSSAVEDDSTTSSTTTVYVTVAPSSTTTDDITTSSTTTIYVTVAPSSTDDATTTSASTTTPASTSITDNTTAIASTSIATITSASSEDSNTIPRISINPTTTVVVS